MIIETVQYSFEESLARIDQMLNFRLADENASPQVPVLSELPSKGGSITNCTVLQIQVNVSSSDNYGELITVIRAFYAEAVAILSSHSHIIDIQVIGSRLIAVFSTPFRKNIASAIDKAAMVNTLAQVVSKKAKGLGLPDITIRMGMDYGRVMLMRFGRYNAAEIMPSALSWMGDPVDGSSKLISTQKHGWSLRVSRVVYQNLNDDYKKFFHYEEEFRSYGADIINTYMKNWLNKQ
jgi:class 3 adenylate cyclase